MKESWTTAPARLRDGLTHRLRPNAFRPRTSPLVTDFPGTFIGRLSQSDEQMLGDAAKLVAGRRLARPEAERRSALRAPPCDRLPQYVYRRTTPKG